MKRYTIKPEYLTMWGSWTDEDTIVTTAEVERLAAEWEKPVEELLEQLEETGPASISIDNGMHWVDPEEALAEMSLDTIVNYMDDDTREAIAREYAPCSDLEFLTHYLEAAPNDLIVG